MEDIIVSQRGASFACMLLQSASVEEGERVRKLARGFKQAMVFVPLALQHETAVVQLAASCACRPQFVFLARGASFAAAAVTYALTAAQHKADAEAAAQQLEADAASWPAVAGVLTHGLGLSTDAADALHGAGSLLQLCHAEAQVLRQACGGALSPADALATTAAFHAALGGNGVDT